LANRSIPGTAALVLACLTMVPGALGQQVPPEASTARSATTDPHGGIHLDRLTARQLQTWRSIEQIIQAVDRAGQPLHPRLLSLWRWAQRCSHTIYIELLEEKDPSIYRAGFFTIQGSNSTDSRRIAVIQLYCRVIEEASVQERVRRSDGFIPFEGLGKLERYAQVFGHELAHAALQLGDPIYDRFCRELQTEEDVFLSSRQLDRKGTRYDEATLQRLAHIQSLREQLEEPVRSTEVEIWRELLAGQRARAAVK